MNVAVEAQEIVASKDGVIVVRITLYNAFGVPLPLSEQPINRYQVWLLIGPNPKMLHQCSNIGDALGWAEHESGNQVLSEQDMSDDILEQAFEADVGSESQDLSSIPCVVANVQIVDGFDNAIGKQFVRRWLLCKDDEHVTPLTGNTTHSKVWNRATSLGAQPRNPPLRKAAKAKI